MVSRLVAFDGRWTPCTQTKCSGPHDASIELASPPLNPSSIGIVFEVGHKSRCGGSPLLSGRETMKRVLAAICLAALIAMPQAGRAEDIIRFAPLKAEELNQAQKAWCDMNAEPPRNAKFANPPYRAYIRNPDLAPRLSDRKSTRLNSSHT